MNRIRCHDVPIRCVPGMQAFLESAEINASDAWTLFASLDVDGDNVTWGDGQLRVEHLWRCP